MMKEKGSAMRIIVGIALVLVLLAVALLAKDAPGKEVALVFAICALLGLCSQGRQALEAVSKAEPVSKPEEEPAPRVVPEPPAPADPFVVAGEQYNGFDDLCFHELPQEKWVQRFADVHGRQVLYYAERYPCFDSYDRLYENRYYHYFLIMTDTQPPTYWGRVQFPDEKRGAEVLSEHLPLPELKLRLPSLLAPALDKAAHSVLDA